MNAADATALRTKACNVMAALGAVLDSVTVIDEVIANPADEFAAAVIISQHLDEAMSTAGTLCQYAADLATDLENLQEVEKNTAQRLERGGATVAQEGGAS